MPTTTKQLTYQMKEIQNRAFISEAEFKEARTLYRNDRKSLEGKELAELEKNFTTLEEHYTQQINKQESLLDDIRLLIDKASQGDEYRSIITTLIPSITANPLQAFDSRIAESTAKLTDVVEGVKAISNPDELAGELTKLTTTDRKFARVILDHLPAELAASKALKSVVELTQAEHKKEIDAHRFDQKRSHFINRLDYIDGLLATEPIDWFEVDKSYKRLLSQWQSFVSESELVDEEIKTLFSERCTAINTQLEPVRQQELERREGHIKELAALLDDEKQLKKASNLAREYSKTWKPKVSLLVIDEQALWGRFKPLCDEIFQRYNVQRAAFLESLKSNHQTAEEILSAIQQTIDNQDLNEEAKATSIKELRDQWFANSPLPKNHADELFGRFKALTAPFYKPAKNTKTAEDDKRQRVGKKTNKGKRIDAKTNVRSNDTSLVDLWSSISASLKATLEGDESADRVTVKLPQEVIVFETPNHAIVELELIAGMAPSALQEVAQKRKLERLQLSLNGKLPKAKKEAELVIAGFTRYSVNSVSDLDQWSRSIEKALNTISKMRG